MRHAIVGVGEFGAKVLGAVARDLSETVTTRGRRIPAEYFFVHPFYSENLNQAVGFVPPQNRYQFSAQAQENSKELANKELKKIFGNYPIDVEKAANVLSEISPDINRRLYTSMFQMEGKAFMQRLFESVNDGDPSSCISFLIDSCDVAGAAIVMRALVLTRKAFPKPIKVRLSILYDENAVNALSSELKACCYAFLVELNHRRQPNWHLSVLDVTGEDDRESRIRELGLQFARAQAGLGVARGLDAVPEDPKRKFVDVADLAMDLDVQAIRAGAAQLFAQIVYRSFFYAEFNSDFQRPEWVGKLMVEKQWYLHDDYLRMDIPVGKVKQDASWSTIEKEWESRSEFFMSKLNEDDDWDIQYQDYDRYMSGAYQKMFRGQGVDFFYAVTEGGIQNSAKLISDQIEEQLVLEYRNQKHTLAEIFVILDEIDAKIDQRLQQANLLYEHERKEADANRQRYEEVYKNWESGGKGDRKKIARNTPISDVAKWLTANYVSECHLKSLAFAKKLLKQVNVNIGLIKESIGLGIQGFDERAQELQSGVFRFSMEDRVSAPFFRHWRIAQINNFFDRLPQTLKVDALAQQGEIAANFFRSQVQVLNFSKLFENMLKEKFFEDVVSYIGSNNDFCTGRYVDPQLEAELFRTAVLALAEQRNGEFLDSARNVKELPCKLDPEGGEREAAWYLPSRVFVEEDVERIARGFEEAAPGVAMVPDVDMPVEHVVLRAVRTYSVDKLPGFKDLQTEYCKFILTKNSFIHTLSLHPDLTAPFCPYDDEFVAATKPDAIRKALLHGELSGHVVCNDDGVFLGYHIGSEGVMFLVGKNFQDVLENASPTTLRFVKYIMDEQEELQLKPEMADVLSNRLEQIKMVCLNGKSDVRKATWQEAGTYMPWSRMGEALLDKIKAIKS